MSFRDDWPKMPDGSDFDGKQLLALVRSGDSPFHGLWDVELLIREIEVNLAAEVIEIPMMFKGSKNYVSLATLTIHFDTKTKSGLRTGFPPQAIKPTKHRGTFSSRRCQHARL